MNHSPIQSSAHLMLGFLASLFTYTLSPTAYAGNIAVDFNSDAVHFQTEANHSSNKIAYSGELLLGEENGDLLSFNAHSNGRTMGNSGIRGGFGFKLYALDDNNDTYTGLGFGVNLESSFMSVDNLNIEAQVYYTPDSTLSGSANSLVDTTVQLRYKAFENSSIYGGFRLIEARFGRGTDHEFTSGVHIGFRFKF